MVEVTWEEQMYWKHFYAIHFYQVLPHDFFHHLVLPSKFAEKMSDKIPKKLSLIGPSGSSWDVDLSRTSDLAIVGDGWKDFAKTFNLEENNLLMFKYTQNLSFEVLIFDQQNLCEKECCYFAKKCLPKPNKIDRKRSSDETASAELMEDNKDGGGSDCVLSKKLKKCSTDQGLKNAVEVPRATPSDDSPNDFSNGNDVEVVTSGGTPIHQVSVSLMPNEAGILDGIPITGLVATNSKGQSAGKPSDNDTNGISMLSQMDVIQLTPTGNGKKEMHEAVVLSASKKGNALSDALFAEVMNGNGTPVTGHSRKVGAKRGRPVRRKISRSGQKLDFKSDTRRLSKEYMSCRRVVTNEEKEAALKRATEASTEDSFLVVMRPTAVYKRFFLSIPAGWVNQNISCHHQKVILRVGEKTWVAFFHNYGRGRHSGGLAAGWKNFAVGNNLEDSDVCVFKPASEKGDATLILDIQIFRVVPEITPLMPLLCSVV